MKLLTILIILALPIITQTVASEVVKQTQEPISSVIIDVRTMAEWDQGHHPQAKHIEWQNIVAGVESLKLDKTTPIVLYCRSGNRAGKAQKLLESAGFSQVTNGVNLRNLTKN